MSLASTTTRDGFAGAIALPCDIETPCVTKTLFDARMTSSSGGAQSYCCWTTGAAGTAVTDDDTVAIMLPRGVD